MNTMRVMANLCSVLPGQVGGSEEYATRLLNAVITSRSLLQTTHSMSHDTHPSGESAQHPSIELELAAMAGTHTAHPELDGLVWHEAGWCAHNRLRRLAVESTWLAQHCADFDVVHHFGGRLPIVRRGAAVLTIHDVQPLDLPENFSTTKRQYLGIALRRSAHAAAVVTVPSVWVARRVVERLGVSPDRVRVVPSTYSDCMTASVSAVSSLPVGGSGMSDVGSVAGSSLSGSETFSEPWRDGPFVLYPAATYPHKNHRLLISAHAAVRARYGDITLVLTGGRGRAHAAVEELVACTPGVVHLGRVSEARLASLFSEAAAVAIPSCYEGFGLPALEAMAAGTPVIAANATALPEVLGDAGLLVGTDDLDGWIDALFEARVGSSEISLRVEKGRIRAACYAPQKMAARLVNAWLAAVDQSSDVVTGKSC